MPDTTRSAHVVSEPEVTMSAVKLDRNGNVVETIPFTNVQASPGFIEQVKRAMREGWEEGKQQRKDD